ncbi:HAD family hydrolase [Gilvimarinus algae]|uniref:HAD family hydrolase n=1 Tax=Gilvimarinus algae TaxID=3058037 RepID=A0ABT8TKB4_9GAMM|nr:HAD family hydrolase [Gilvimarinus sp. SDUM040014]MDO3383096.1 HAD family hydrolase [Gilvimarinus sp. SDUM040014]
MNRQLQPLSRSPRYAFFDVDDTLISVKSMLSFQDFWYQTYRDPEAEQRYRQDLTNHLHEGACWSTLNRLYYRHFAGRRVTEVEQLGRQWFTRERKNPAFYHQSVVNQLRWHQARGDITVFVSGSFPALLHPIAEELQVDHTLAIQMEAASGCYTGEILPPQTIGEGKAEAIRAFIQAIPVNLSECYAYGDDVSDLPMLSLVGYPRVIAGGRALEVHARQHGWPVLAPH